MIKMFMFHTRLFRELSCGKYWVETRMDIETHESLILEDNLFEIEYEHLGFKLKKYLFLYDKEVKINLLRMIV